MSAPFFSIAVPSKDRPERLQNAVRSLLDQTFEDIQVIVCDNSDEPAETKRVVDGFDDARVTYIRTSGHLSMPDNWETAIADARGEFVGVLTDRSVFRRDALQVVRNEIEATDARCVTWYADLFGRDPEGQRLKRRVSTMRRHRFESRAILDYYLNGHPKFASKIIPKLMTSVFHRSILDAVRASAVGRCCPPVCPDYTSGFLMLGHTDWVLTLDEALYVGCGYGTGAAFRSRSALGDRFRHDLGLGWADMVDRMPSAACFSHALILNDLMRIRDTLTDRYPGLELNRTQYYLGCLNDYVKTTKHGVERNDDMNLLLEALEQEPAEIKDQVRTTRMYATVAATLSGENKPKRKPKAPRVTEDDDSPDFADVFEAMRWDEANPRTPAEESFLDSLPGLDELKKTRMVDRVLNR